MSVDVDDIEDSDTSSGYYTPDTQDVGDLSALSLSEFTGLSTLVVEEHANRHQHPQVHNGHDEHSDGKGVNLPPDACMYCGIHSPASVVKCLICSKWFCSSQDNTSPSHIVNHLLRAKHRDSRSESSPSEANPGCHNCGNKNVFRLGFVVIQDKVDRLAAILLCRQPCAPNFKDIDLNSSLWAPLSKEHSFLTWLISPPSETEESGSCQISFAQMDCLEDLWRDSQPNTITATPETELWPQRQTIQEDDSSDVGGLSKEVYIEGQTTLQVELDKALAELRDLQAENKYLTDENQSQQCSISQFKIALDEVKDAQDHSLVQIKDVQAENQRLTDENQSQQCSISQFQIALDEVKDAQDRSLVQIKDAQAENQRLTDENQSLQHSISQLTIALDEVKKNENKFHDATTSLIIFLLSAKENEGWQNKLDLMQHKLDIAEQRLRCLDHLTRYKLESRQDAAYGQSNLRGLSPPSKDIIKDMRALNEEICQTCVELAKDCLDRSKLWNRDHKSRAQKVLGDHLTSLMEGQAATPTLDYDVLLMQSALQVFMVYWCASIIQAFYPKRESFADLLIQLSAKTKSKSGPTAICGKQIRIVQPSTPYSDSIEFEEWAKDIIEELGVVLMVGGMRTKTQCTHRFTTKIMALIIGAYDLRTAMAEKDTCGGLEVVIVAPDTPFQEKWMTDAHAAARKDDTDRSHVEFVAATIGIGLQSKVLEKVNGKYYSGMKTELKPRVILQGSLNIEANRVDSSQYLTGQVYAKGHLHIWRLRNE